ncbi:hypothetical protein J1N35_022154 [Gossypium stocksii]|uniref:J domain-containing protein n=1 Tax=Gossypium stocksii TaxID=47602 RepID=A0A9D3VG32_9ROSI|nr:hypothetical protein J1N35_022154 [Gossypium stocksii]
MGIQCMRKLLKGILEIQLSFHSYPTPSQIKAAYRKKVWESHPDLFPVHKKHSVESKFKLISIDGQSTNIKTLTRASSHVGAIDP